MQRAIPRPQPLPLAVVRSGLVTGALEISEKFVRRETPSQPLSRCVC